MSRKYFIQQSIIHNNWWYNINWWRKLMGNYTNNPIHKIYYWVFKERLKLETMIIVDLGEKYLKRYLTLEGRKENIEWAETNYSYKNFIKNEQLKDEYWGIPIRKKLFAYIFYKINKYERRR